MKYFLTGATGFVGGRIAELLCEAGHEVVALVRDPARAGKLSALGVQLQDFDGIILQARHITPDFFDLKTGMAGEVLQKFSYYRMCLAIVGDFSAYGSKSLQEFILEGIWVIDRVVQEEMKGGVKLQKHCWYIPQAAK